MGEGEYSCLAPTQSRYSWGGFSCVSLDTLLALSEPWFPHLQNEDRFGIGPCHPGLSVSLMTQEPKRGWGKERG